MHYISDRIGEFKNINELLKTREPLKAIEKLLEDKQMLERKLEAMEARHLVQVRNELLQKDEIVNGINFIGDVVEVNSADGLKKLCFELKSKLNDYVAVVCANIGGKPFVAVGISDSVVAARQLDAGKIIKEIVAPRIKGGGGGQKTLATAGGQDASALRSVIDAVKQIL
jgi:alanyl-tRNA synthetase